MSNIFVKDAKSFFDMCEINGITVEADICEAKCGEVCVTHDNLADVIKELENYAEMDKKEGWEDDEYDLNLRALSLGEDGNTYEFIPDEYHFLTTKEMLEKLSPIHVLLSSMNKLNLNLSADAYSLINQVFNETKEANYYDSIRDFLTQAKEALEDGEYLAYLGSDEDTVDEVYSVIVEMIDSIFYSYPILYESGDLVPDAYLNGLRNHEDSIGYQEPHLCSILEYREKKGFPELEKSRTYFSQQNECLSYENIDLEGKREIVFEFTQN